MWHNVKYMSKCFLHVSGVLKKQQNWRLGRARLSSSDVTLTSIIERAAGGRRDLEETRVNEGRERRGRLVLRHGGSL